ncbi:hypothetical protein WMF18_31675 [Sorangium sp. So ce315]|uniref:hypothetical protein n=1 Tax=Sorangium sp. So ce315 TaxID=3133299 RepID=UPI003F61F592
MQSKIYVLMLCVVGALAMGCNVCEDLDARMCGDLGAEDCALWRENGLNFTAQAKSRPRRMLRDTLFGADAQTCESAGSDAVYSQILQATKAQVAAVRKAKQAVEAVKK